MSDQVFGNGRGGRSGTPGHVDGVIAELSAGQDGIVTTDDLRVVGLSETGIHKRAARGSLHRLYPNVYAVGDSLVSLRGRWRAAIRACGPDAVLSHRDAAMLWGLMGTSRSRIDVTATGQRGRKLDGIDRHKAALLPSDRAIHDGIACTSPARTMLDLAGVCPERPAEKAYEQGWILGLLDIGALEDVIERVGGGHHGARALKRLVQRYHGSSTLTHSDLEELFLSLSIEPGSPVPSSM